VIPTTVIPLRGVTDHQALVGELEQGLAHRRPADPELAGDLVEVEAGAGLQPTGEDPVAQLGWPPGPGRSADRLDI
jgi:hypothetical protein